MASAASLSFSSGVAGASRVRAVAARRSAATRAGLKVRAHGPGGGVHLDPNESVAPSQAPKGVAGALLDRDDVADEGRKNVYVETYGCQMNVNDSDVIQLLEQKIFQL